MTSTLELKRFSISGMTCAGCVSRVESALQSVSGVDEALVNLVERTAQVHGTVATKTLIAALRTAGYGAAELQGVHDEEVKEAAERAHYHTLLWQSAVVAALLGFPLMFLDVFGAMPPMYGAGRLFWIAVAVPTLGVMAYCGARFYSGAWKSLYKRSANMDTFIGLGTGVAWLYSTVITIFPEGVPEAARHVYFEATVVIIIALINLGSVLRARGKTSQAIKRLIGLQPRTARVIREGKELDTPIAEVGLDDTVRVRPGEKIPVDGIIIDGHIKLVRLFFKPSVSAKTRHLHASLKWCARRKIPNLPSVVW